MELARPDASYLNRWYILKFRRERGFGSAQQHIELADMVIGYASVFQMAQSDVEVIGVMFCEIIEIVE
jgi:hypothetical protein